MGLLDYINPFGKKSPLKGLNNSLTKSFLGTPEKRENVSTLRPEQEGLYQQLVNSGRGAGAGGAFGQSADYYRNLLGDNSSDFNSFAAPQMRQFNEEILPGLSEQFAGLGSGGLASSGFRNAATNAGVDLAERLGAIRAGLRQQGAQGLQNIGQMGLQNFSQNMVTEPGSGGLLAPALGAVGTAIGGPALGAAGAAGGNWLSGQFNKSSGSGGNSVGMNKSPYQGSSISASPTFGQQNNLGWNPPNKLARFNF